MAKNYDTNGNSWNNPLQHNDANGNYSKTNGLLGFLDSTLNLIGFGDANASSNLFAELTGYNSQQREFEQQEYLMDKQNLYNRPIEQMQRMKDAGINLNTAAAGIAQGGNESAQAPAVSSNTQGASAGLSAASSMLGSLGQAAQVVSQVKKNNAEAENAMAGAIRSNTLLPFDMSLTLENIGLTKANAQAVAIENYYKPESLMLGIAQMRLTLPILKKQYDVLDSEYKVNMQSIDNMIQEIEESKARVDAMTYVNRLNSALTTKAQNEANFIARKFQILKDLNWDVTTGIGGLLAGRAVYEGVDGLELHMDKLQDGLFKINFAESSGTSKGSYGTELGLIKAREAAEGRLQSHQGKIDIGKEGLKSALDVSGSHVRHRGVHAFGFGFD